MAAKHSGDNINLDTEESDTIPELVTKIEPKKFDGNFDEEEDPYIRLPCNKCRKNATTKRCANCKSVYYCSRECQKKDWSSHKGACLDLPLFRKKSNTKKESKGNSLSDQIHLRKLIKEAVTDENVYNFQVVKDLLESSQDKNPCVDHESDGTPITLLQLAANYGRMDVFEHVHKFVNKEDIENLGEMMKTCLVNYNASVLDEMCVKDKTKAQPRKGQKERSFVIGWQME